MNPSNRVTQDDLSAYVDGELSDTDREAVEEWLKGHPEDAASVQAYHQQNIALRDLHRAVLDEPVPEKMLQLLQTPAPRRPGLPWVQVAAAVLLLLIGGAGGWGLRGGQQNSVGAAPPSFVERAVGAYFVYTSEVLHPVEVTADREDHLVAWLSKRLGNPLKAPRLTSAGYRLVGGRLLEDSGSPAAQFMYEDASGRRITVYVRTYEGKDTAFKYFENGGISAFYWIDAPFAYALAGELPREELMKISRLVYKDITP